MALFINKQINMGAFVPADPEVVSSHTPELSLKYFALFFSPSYLTLVFILFSHYLFNELELQLGQKCPQGTKRHPSLD